MCAHRFSADRPDTPEGRLDDASDGVGVYRPVSAGAGTDVIL